MATRSSSASCSDSVSTRLPRMCFIFSIALSATTGFDLDTTSFSNGLCEAEKRSFLSGVRSSIHPQEQWLACSSRSQIGQLAMVIPKHNPPGHQHDDCANNKPREEHAYVNGQFMIHFFSLPSGCLCSFRKASSAACFVGSFIAHHPAILQSCTRVSRNSPK